MTSDRTDARVFVGKCLRFPFVLGLAVWWMVGIWWWLVAGAAVIGVGLLILAPLVYPVLYAVTWIALAFQNSRDPVLPDYWKGYPKELFSLVKPAAKLGFGTLFSCLHDGFEVGFSWWH